MSEVKSVTLRKNLFFIMLLMGLSWRASAQRETLSPADISQMSWVDAMLDERVDVPTVVKKFESFWDGKEIEKGKGYKQFKRWQYFMEQRMGPNGERPSATAWFDAVQSANGAPAEYGWWTPLGPENAPSGSGIGRINCVHFHPQHPDTVFAGTPAGGLWVSYNGGQSWETHTDDLTNLGVSDLAIDPVHSDTMYLATGDRDGADTYSFGLLRSTDGGLTWQPTGLSPSITSYMRIGRVLVHPVQHNIVLVAASSGMYRSTDYGATFSIMSYGNFVDIEFGGGGTYYASETGYNPEVFKSTNYGQSWTALSSGLPSSGTYRCELAVAESNTSTVYALFGSSSQGFGGLYRSTNGGSSWSLMSNSPNVMGWDVAGGDTDGQAWYDMALEVDPLNANVLYVGGVNIWKSINGGSSWSIAAHWYGANGTPYVHADHHHLNFKPGSSELFVGSDGGVYKTANGGSTWTAYNNGMNITQYYKISQSTSNEDLILGGAQDNGTHLKTSTSWDRVYGGDGMDNGVDVNNDQVLYASVYHGNFYRSNNQGSSFFSINTFSAAGSGNWVTPFEVDPVTSNVIYAGYSKLWKSTNGGSSWSATSTSSFSDKIDEFKISPSNTSIIYAAVNEVLYKSTNGGATWLNVTPTGVGTLDITGIDIDPNNANHVVFTLASYNAGNVVYESVNGGSSWTHIGTGLPNVPANCVLIDGSELYVGTDIGVFYKGNSSGGWVSFNKNLPNVIVTDFELYAPTATLRIGTFGRGVWESPLMSASSAPPVASFDIIYADFCQPFDSAVLSSTSTFADSLHWSLNPSTYSFVAGTNASSPTPHIAFSSGGTYSVTLSAFNSNGQDDTTWTQAIQVGGIVPNFTQNFEDGLGRWTLDNPDGASTFVFAQVAGADGTASTQNTALKLNHYNYSTLGQVDHLNSPVFSLQNILNPRLDFDFAYTYYSAAFQDSLRVEISEDCGKSWALLESYSVPKGNYATVSSTYNPFTPASATDWCGSSVNCGDIDLSNYEGKDGLQIRLSAYNGYGNNLYLDNISVTGTLDSSQFASPDCIACDSLAVGSYFVVDGDSIEVVDRIRLLALVAAQADLTKVCVSHVTDMKNVFRGAKWFNQDISRWDVSNVTTFRAMFFNAETFNQDLSGWDVGAATDLTDMFFRADSFNQPIGVWDVSQVALFSRMFKEAGSFRADLSAWDVSSAVRMGEMFRDAANFDGDLASWCVPNFEYYNVPTDFETGSLMGAADLPHWGNCPNTYDDVNGLATGAYVNAAGCVDCSALNVGDYFELGGDTMLVVNRDMLDSLVLIRADLSKICVSHITDMTDALRGQTWFNTDISGWDVSGVTSMNNMFRKALFFNQDIGNWDVSGVTNMSRAFYHARAFNQDIGGWDVSAVTRFNTTFKRAVSFNQDLSGWDVSSAFNMDNMFRRATSFSQDLSSWCVSLIPSKPTGFDANSGMSTSQLPQWGTCGGSSFVAQSPQQNGPKGEVDMMNTEVTLFPNPTSGAVEINPVLDGSFVLYGEHGQVLERGSIRAVYDLSNRPKGLYILALRTQEETHFFKVVKM